MESGPSIWVGKCVFVLFCYLFGVFLKSELEKGVRRKNSPFKLDIKENSVSTHEWSFSKKKEN